ncbi:MAG: M23 family metallopeptidase [Thermoproteota archaeon]|jgi:murein DD-endopeptidase MepM/ murein hydrolase activator NlpD|nr:M23 family metallopeptidase [Thermoproteota archaeon]
MNNHIQENLFQTISSMVLNIIQTSMTAHKQFTGGSTWNVSPMSNVPEQITKTKHKVATNKSAINKYKLPIPKDLLQRIDRTSSPAHVGKLRNAIDFVADIGTPVLAAEDGLVTSVKDTSNRGGANLSNWRHTNFIVIMHSNGEYSRYDHLSYNSSKVKVGQYVRAGEEIAKVGMTGYTYLPHLHFQVFVLTGSNMWTDFDTLEVKDFVDS